MITFKVEDVTPASEPLDNISFDKLVHQFGTGIQKNSHQNENLIDFGQHAFLNGLHVAYAEHRPFVISPDTIWTMIAQGFAHHVNKNHVYLKSMFVEFEGKKTIKYENQEIEFNNPDSPWELIIDGLLDKTKEFLGSELTEIFNTNFSTTTEADRLTSIATLLYSQKNYFEYQGAISICGIPEITVKGTSDDWKQLIDKTQYLGQYDLDWWTDELIILLKQIKQTVDGASNKTFWKNIFKIKEGEGCGDPDLINGWIARFFPYDDDGNVRMLDTIKLDDIYRELPAQTVSVPILLKNEQLNTSINSLFTAGLMGAKQHKESLAIEPQNCWLIGLNDRVNDKIETGSEMEYEIYDEFPYQILNRHGFRHLILHFKKDFFLPMRLKQCFFVTIEVNGNFSDKDIRSIRALKAVKIVANGIVLWDGNKASNA